MFLFQLFEVRFGFDGQASEQDFSPDFFYNYPKNTGIFVEINLDKNKSNCRSLFILIIVV